MWVSDAEHEALRDLSRAREAARTAQHQARQQILALLLRLGVEEPGETRRWTQRYRSWLGELSLEQPLQRLVLADALEAVDAATARLARLEDEVKQAATEGRHAPLIGARAAPAGGGGDHGGDAGGRPGGAGAVPDAASADGVRGAGAERALERDESAVRADHQGRAQPRTAGAGASRVALSASAEADRRRSRSGRPDRRRR